MLGRKFNPLRAIMKMTSSHEDVLTEFVVAALEADASFRARYAGLVLGDYATARGWAPPVIVDWCTQGAVDGCVGTPDVVLGLADGHRIIVEHKIEADETSAFVDGAETPSGQLDRYLRSNIDGVAFFRRSWKSPSDEVLAHPLYIRPGAQPHFLWRDLYPFLVPDNKPATRWLREYFEDEGDTPPHPVIGDLMDADPERQKSARQNFAKLWDGTRGLASSLGWKVTTGSICELYLSESSRGSATVYLSPLHRKGASLIIRVTPRDPRQVVDLAKSLKGVLTIPHGQVETTQARRQDGLVEVVDLTVPWREILSSRSDAFEMDESLCDFVLPLLHEITYICASAPGKAVTETG